MCWWQPTPASCLRKTPLDPLKVGETYRTTPAVAAKPPVYATPAETARDVDGVLMCLLDTTAVEDVVFGANGIASAVHNAFGVETWITGVVLVILTGAVVLGGIGGMFGRGIGAIAHAYAIGIGTAKRSTLIPDVPPIADTLPGFEAVFNRRLNLNFTAQD